MQESGSPRNAAGQFVPGISGNPAGRPKGHTLISAIKAELDSLYEDGSTKAQALAKKLVDMALAGDLQAAKLLVDRLWPIKLELDHGSQDGRVLIIERSFVGLQPTNGAANEPKTIDVMPENALILTIDPGNKGKT